MDTESTPISSDDATGAIAVHPVGGVYDAARILAQPDYERKLITINLLRDHSVTVEAPDAVAAAPLPPPVAVLAPVAAVPPAVVAVMKPSKARSKKIIILSLAIAICLMAIGAAAIVARSSKKIAEVPVKIPLASIAPTPSAPLVSPTAAPTPAPTPVPTPLPKAETITTPSTTPTVEHPQAVTIKSPSGLWLRSSPTSENRSNIISWMPNGAIISADGVGEFWWHGTYKGLTGFFASTYTK